MTDDWNEIAFAARLHLQDGKTIFVVMKRHSLNGTDERFSVWGSVEGSAQAGCL
jgi:hypothetical protein